MDLFVRDAQPEDAEAIAQILNPIIETGAYSVLATPVSVELERKFILNFPPEEFFTSLSVVIIRELWDCKT